MINRKNDVDFDHQFIETEKYDAKPTYKKFLLDTNLVYIYKIALFVHFFTFLLSVDLIFLLSVIFTFLY